jgi:capsular polysaccharide biosynthesis protein
VDDPDQTVTIGRAARDEVSAGTWAEDDSLLEATDGTAGLASLAFITAAIRRRTRFWCVAGIIGLVLGAGLYIKHPPPAQAKTELYLTLGPAEDLNTAMQTDAALAESRPIAQQVIGKLQLPESVGALLNSYSATPVTNLILLITVKAPSSDEAVRRATALASEFLQFRTDQLKKQQQLQINSLNEQVAQGKALADSVIRQISALPPNPTDPTQQARLHALRAQLTQANGQLAALEQSTRATRQQLQVATDAAVNNSRVLNAASAVTHSKVKTAGLYSVSGLIAGLVLGIGIVIIQALASDRLRRRDDVAVALGAPVRLSVGRMNARREKPGRRRPLGSERQGPDMRRMAAHLDSLVQKNSRGPSGLAIVPVDSTDVAALSLAALAVSAAQQGQRVILADLSPGARAGRLLGSAKPGVRTVNVDDARLVVAVPETYAIPSAGPLNRSAARPQVLPTSEPLIAAYESADLLLTLIPLDPALGSEHLTSWASDTAVIVTTGRSSSTKIHAAGEMIRLSGASLVSAILVGADKGDESLGMTAPPAPAPERDRFATPHANGTLAATRPAAGARHRS